jgi:transcriptional regulator with XRE-family HTH domain
VDAAELLRKQVESSSQAVVARELGISKSTVSQLLSGKYGASSENIDRKILMVYGGERGVFKCLHTGEDITPLDCAITWERAVAAGGRAPGNPTTLRQYHACRNCDIRR